MTEKDALIIFYAVFWAAQLSAVSKFSPFGIAGLSKKYSDKSKNILRYFLAIIILNILPTLLLYCLYAYFIRDKITATSIISICIASLSVFAWGNIWNAIFNSKLSSTLYNDKELENLKKHNNLEDNPWYHYLFLAFLYLLWPLILLIRALIKH